MFNGLTNPSEYFEYVLVCWFNGEWERIAPIPGVFYKFYKAELVIGITEQGGTVILKNRYGNTTFG